MYQTYWLAGYTTAKYYYKAWTVSIIIGTLGVNTLRPRWNGRHLAGDVFKCIFLNENVKILLKISQKFVPNGPINNIPSLVQVMAWRRPGDKPLPEPIMVSLLTHICVARPQWVNIREHCSRLFFQWKLWMWTRFHMNIAYYHWV